ncbi:hypothetical protein [Streptomyces sp. NPDC058457]|uniref:hypothetical protein n=1 Tax=Streptomyces sp. NPDC058457 TaxID=3346507 RepID=UPI003654BA2B
MSLPEGSSSECFPHEPAVLAAGRRAAADRPTQAVRLQSRTGRDVTALWMDLAMAAMRLPPGLVLDGVM